jgi:molybdopterin converting factor small subunit
MTQGMTPGMPATVRVQLPAGLRALAGTPTEVLVTLDAPVTQRRLLDALEARYPTLRGTIRDHTSQRRRPFVRFFACEMDLSHAAPDVLLPLPVAEGREVFMVVGAIAGG